MIRNPHTAVLQLSLNAAASEAVAMDSSTPGDHVAK